MPECRLTSKPRGGGNFGGKLVCFCRQLTIVYAIPEEVRCARYSGDQLRKWKELHKISLHADVNSVCPSQSATSYSEDISTPMGLANFYKNIIETFGFRSAAYALEVSKF